MTLMTELKTSSLQHIGESRERIEKCLAYYDLQILWQRPNPASNSMGNLVLHLCGNITQYILSSLGGQPDQRQRDEEFAATGGPAPAELLQRFNAVITQAAAVIENLPDSEWLRVRPVQCYQLSGLAIVLHVVEHLSYHTGQLAFYTKQVQNVDLGFYAGQQLNATGD
jgi:uncharacterized damage-inducible protein DinB